MQVVKGTVVAGKVVLAGPAPPEGAEVAVFVQSDEDLLQLPPHLRHELEEALGEADVSPGITPEELFAELRQYG
jgi:hypothetical protein